MAQPIAKPMVKDDPITRNAGSILGTVGRVVGGFFGPVGSAAGGMIGGMAGDSIANEKAEKSKAMDIALQNKIDKANAVPKLERGLEILKDQDSDTQEQYAPVLQEALMKARMQQDEIRKRRSQFMNEEIA